MVIIPAATRKFDKKHTLIGSALLVILNINLPIILSLWRVSAGSPLPGSSTLLYLLILSAVVTSALGVTLYATLNSMFADITDEHELEVGERREGVIFAARAFAVKATASLGLILGGILLDFIALPKGRHDGPGGCRYYLAAWFSSRTRDFGVYLFWHVLLYGLSHRPGAT